MRLFEAIGDPSVGHGGGQFLHGGRSLLPCGGLLLSTHAQVTVATGDLAAARKASSRSLALRSTCHQLHIEQSARAAARCSENARTFAA